MIALWVGLWAAVSLPSTEDVAAAAAAEASAFEALQDERDCDAAASFLRAFSLVHDERLLLNAGLAFEQAGDRAAAREALVAIEDNDVAARAAPRLEGLGPTTLRCPIRSPAPAKTTTTTTTTTTPTTPTKTSATTAPAADPPAAPPPLLGIGIGALAGGAIVGVGALGGALLQQRVLGDAGSSGEDKQSAMAASWPLVFSGAIAALLLVGGGVLVPVSLGATPEGA